MQWESSHRPSLNEWRWIFYSKIWFTKTNGEQEFVNPWVRIVYNRINSSLLTFRKGDYFSFPFECGQQCHVFRPYCGQSVFLSPLPLVFVMSFPLTSGMLVDMPWMEAEHVYLSFLYNTLAFSLGEDALLRAAKGN
jgi:hypothetical protein